MPIIDLTPARRGSNHDRRHVAEQMDAACREIGFFTITGHGVPDHIVDDLRGGAPQHTSAAAFGTLGINFRARKPVATGRA